MAAPKVRRLKYITLTIAGVSYECQVTDWKVNPPQNVVGDKIYTACPGGEFREETDPEDWSIDLTWFSDWTATGLNRYLWANQGATAAIILTQHSDITGEAVRWTGSVYIAAPAVGGKTRETETSEITLLGVGTVPTPTYPTVP